MMIMRTYVHICKQYVDLMISMMVMIMMHYRRQVEKILLPYRTDEIKYKLLLASVEENQRLQQQQEQKQQQQQQNEAKLHLNSQQV